MSFAAHPALQSLVTRVRNELWRENALLKLSQALAWSGAILLAAGLLHKLYAPMNWHYSVFVAALPIFAALIVTGIRGRPSLAAAATAADRRLGSRELLCSAFEQSRLAIERRTGTAPVVLERAERMAESVRPADYRRRRLPVSVLISLGLGFAGVMLQLTPGHARPTPLGDPQVPPESTANAPASAPFAELQTVLADVRARATAARSAPGAGDPLAESAFNDSPAMGASIPNEPEPRSNALPGAIGARTTPTGVSPGKPGGDQAGDTADQELQEARLAARRLPSQPIDIPRREGDKGSTSASPVVATPIASGPNDYSDVAPAEGASQLRRSRFGPALRKYAGDYLRSLRESP